MADARRELEEARQTAISAPPKTGLEVVIDADNPTAFPGVGLILQIEFKVTNHDPMEHTLSRRIESESPVYFGPHGVTDDPEHTPLWQAFGAMWDQQHGAELPRSVRPGETVRGVWVVEFDWDPERMLPDYALIISDGSRDYKVRPHPAAETEPEV